MSHTKLIKLIINNFSLITLIFIFLNQAQNLNSQATGNSWMDNQTVIGNQTTMGLQSDMAFNAQPITTASPATIPLAADDPGASPTAAAPTGFVVDTAGASYISGIDAAPATPPAGTTGTSKPTTGPISTKIADLAKVAVAEPVANLCAARAIIGDIPGCSSTADTSTKPAAGPVSGANKAGSVGAAPPTPSGPATTKPGTAALK
jgi:hypothetical protein